MANQRTISPEQLQEIFATEVIGERFKWQYRAHAINKFFTDEKSAVISE